MNTEELSELFPREKYTFVRGKPASEFTTFRVGGGCDTVLYPADVGAFVRAVKLLKESGEKFCVLGAGSNVLFSDEGYRGTVVLTTEIKTVNVKENTLYAECGAPLVQLCRAALDASLTGLEFAYGIPGTLGGAVFMNAGAYDGEMKNAVSSVTVYDADTDKIITYDAADCDFSYRHSRFQNSGELVLSAELKLQPGEKGSIRKKMNELMGRRRDKQPLNYPSAGSVFKRYPGRYTAAMIDAAGLKGYSIGGAQVSEKHAGFIINKGGATSADIKALIKHIQSEIKRTEGIDIECEIRFIG